MGGGENGNWSSMIELIEVRVIFAGTVSCVGHDFCVWLVSGGNEERGERAARGVDCSIEWTIYVPSSYCN